MQSLRPEELILEGAWVESNNGVEADDVCTRIEWLIADDLTLIEAGDWVGLYQDAKDSRYWLLSYPLSHMHGGGPPKLKLLSSQEAKEFSGSAVST